MPTADLLRALGVLGATADAWAPVIAAACARHAITSRQRVAAFVANVLVETGMLTALVESLNYSAAALLRTWPSHFTPELADQIGRTSEHPADQRQIAEHAYGNRLGNGPVGSGDGWLYRGRGLIQLTGRSNYASFATKIAVPLTDLPALLQLPAGAAESAAAYWQATGCNEEADRGDIEAVRRLVNGGENGLPLVRVLYTRALGLIPEAAPAPPVPVPAPALPPGQHRPRP